MTIKFGISVVIPSHNRRELLTRAIESVRSDYRHETEIIVVDDCSDAFSIAELPKQNGSGIPIRAFRLARNAGPQTARNLGIRRAKFRYVAFLDSDDSFSPDKIDTVRDALWREDCDLLFHAVEGMPRYNFIGRFWAVHLRKLLPFDWLIILLNPVITPSLVMRKSGRLGVPGLRHAEDWAFLLHYCYPGMSVCFLNMPLSRVYRAVGSPGGESQARWKMRRGEFIARRVLLKQRSVSAFAKFVIGSAVGVLRILLDLARGRYIPKGH